MSVYFSERFVRNGGKLFSEDYSDPITEIFDVEDETLQGFCKDLVAYESGSKIRIGPPLPPCVDKGSHVEIRHGDYVTMMSRESWFQLNHAWILMLLKYDPKRRFCRERLVAPSDQDSVRGACLQRFDSQRKVPYDIVAVKAKEGDVFSIVGLDNEHRFFYVEHDTVREERRTFGSALSDARFDSDGDIFSESGYNYGQWEEIGFGQNTNEANDREKDGWRYMFTTG
ncbi:hypothetical protein IJV57_05380 [Candidatus Saccharibacteria bacterium]|nr:hypothetical protein [Candidatus Saccharibacteria bacterium]